MKNDLEYLKEGINDEQKENLVLELSKMKDQYLKKSKKSKNIIRLKGNYKEITKQVDDLDIPKDVKERIKSEVFKIFLK